jgi:translocation protein SEC63
MTKANTGLFTKNNIIKFLSYGALVLLFFVCYDRADSVEPMKAFDPFQILDISSEATKSEIKKAFRMKSLETHPDKNPDDPLAASKFLQVTRAHQALTDETSIENYSKYGNPDGPGSMKVAIGLPYFLMKKENQVMSLVVAFLFILVIIPGGFFYWYSGSYSYTDKGLKVDDGKRFAGLLNENQTFLDLPKFISLASDFDHIKIQNKTEVEYLMKINYEQLDNKGPKYNPKKGVLKSYKANMLLMFYMFRVEVPDKYQEIIDMMMEKTSEMIDLCLEISLSFHMQFRSRRSEKNMTFHSLVTILKFSQHFIQGIKEFDSQLFQLPNMDLDKINKICKKMNKKEVTLQEYILLDKQSRKEHGALTDKEQAEVEKCINHLPSVKVTAQIVTDGDEDIVLNDIVTIKIKLERLDLEDNQKVPPVCSRTYPYIKTPVYYIYLTDMKEMNIFAFVKLIGTDKVVENNNIKFQAFQGMVGDCALKIHCYNDSYVGLDVFSEIKFTVKDLSGARKMYDYHEEDVKREPTLFEQALQGLKDENSDDDLSESDDDKFSSMKKKAKLSSDEEEDEEEEKEKND